MHDLIRRYARVVAHHNVAHDVRETALRRVLDFYTHSAHTAACFLHPQPPPIRLSSPAKGVHALPMPDHRSAMAWLDNEHPVLLAAQHTAARHARYPTVAVKAIDRVVASARAALLLCRLALGDTVDSLAVTDPGRAMVMPLLQAQNVLANLDEDSPLCFGVLDGRRVPSRYREVLDLDETVTEVVLASDGISRLRRRCVMRSWNCRIRWLRIRCVSGCMHRRKPLLERPVSMTAPTSVCECGASRRRQTMTSD